MSNRGGAGMRRSIRGKYGIVFWSILGNSFSLGLWLGCGGVENHGIRRTDTVPYNHGGRVV